MSTRHKTAFGLPQGVVLNAHLSERKPRVLLADDQAIVAAGICKLLEPDYEVIGIVGDGRTLLVEARKLRPDVIVLEVLLPQLHGMDAARQLTKLVPGCKLVFLSPHRQVRPLQARPFRPVPPPMW